MSEPKQDKRSVAHPDVSQEAAKVDALSEGGRGGGGSAGGAAKNERRGALQALVALGSLAYAGAIAAPAARYIASVGSKDGQGRARWVRVGRVADLPAGEPRRLHVVGDERDAFTLTRDQMLGSVWVVREGAGVRAMSATCPHLGCSIDVNADKKSFGCPCHASRFAISGATEAGPSPRGMDPLETRVVDGWIEVDFRRFRQGTTTREEVGA